MKWLAVLGLVGACGAPQRAERLHEPAPMKHAAPSGPSLQRLSPSLSLAPPGLAIDLAAIEPDPTPELRWPLGFSDHPELAPQLDVAAQLAEPGVDWMRLCKLGAHRRTIPRLADQLGYLRAWCAVADHDVDRAIGVLAQLRTSVVAGMLPAVRADIANILANHGDHDAARRITKRHRIDGDLDILDRLAATYVEVGKLEAAADINALAIANDNQLAPAKSCQRLARRVLLQPESYRSSSLLGIDDKAPSLFDIKLLQDMTCTELDAHLSCWLTKDRCHVWFQMNGLTKTAADLAIAHRVWPTGVTTADPEAWLVVARHAVQALPERAAFTYAVTALEAALTVTPCTDHDTRLSIKAAASVVRDGKTVPAELVKRLDRLVEDQRAMCWKL